MGGKGWGVGTQLVETVRTIMVQQNLLHPLNGEKKENLFGLGILLFSVTDGVSLCAFSSPVHTKTLPVSLTCSSCNLALLLKVCVRFFKDMCGISVLWYK